MISLVFLIILLRIDMIMSIYTFLSPLLAFFDAVRVITEASEFSFNFKDEITSIKTLDTLLIKSFIPDIDNVLRDIT